MSPKNRIQYILKQINEYKVAMNQCSDIYSQILSLIAFSEGEHLWTLSVILNLSSDKPIDETQQDLFMENIVQNEKYMFELTKILALLDTYVSKKMNTYQSRFNELIDTFYKITSDSENCDTKKRKRDEESDHVSPTVGQTQNLVQLQLQSSPSVLKIKQEVSLNTLVSKHKEISQSLKLVRSFMFNNITIIHMLSQSKEYIKSMCSMLITIEKNYTNVVSFVLKKMEFNIRYFENELSIHISKRYEAKFTPYEPLDIYQLFYVYDRTIPLIPDNPPVMDLPVFPQSPEISHFDENNEQVI